MINNYKKFAGKEVGMYGLFENPGKDYEDVYSDPAPIGILGKIDSEKDAPYYCLLSRVWYKNFTVHTPLDTFAMGCKKVLPRTVKYCILDTMQRDKVVFFNCDLMQHRCDEGYEWIPNNIGGELCDYAAMKKLFPRMPEYPLNIEPDNSKVRIHV